MIQADLRVGGARQTVRMKVAEVGEMTIRDARAKAKTLLGSIADGIDPREKKRGPQDQPTVGQVPTLRQAWERYKESHLVRKNRSPKTVQNYDDHIERLFKDWLDLPLSDLGEEPRLVADRHEAITKANGPAIANGAMRSLRAIYNHARKTCRKLPPENPIFAVDWNPEVRRDTALGVRDLPAWFEQVAAMANPVRREFHLSRGRKSDAGVAAKAIEAQPSFGQISPSRDRAGCVFLTDNPSRALAPPRPTIKSLERTRNNRIAWRTNRRFARPPSVAPRALRPRHGRVGRSDPAPPNIPAMFSVNWLMPTMKRARTPPILGDEASDTHIVRSGPDKRNGD